MSETMEIATAGKPKKKLNPKQVKFIRLYTAGSSRADAYSIAYAGGFRIVNNEDTDYKIAYS